MSDFSQDPFVDQAELDAAGHPVPDDVRLPEVTTRTFTLNDDDAGECRTVGEDELAASYVDNNIAAIEPIQPDPWTLDPASIDSQDLRVTYTTGAQYALRLGSIELSGGPLRSDLRKSGGLIFSTDASGRPLFDATNTPRLAAIRQNFHEQLRQRAEDRLEIAEVVYVLKGAVGALGNTANLRF